MTRALTPFLTGSRVVGAPTSGVTSADFSVVSSREDDAERPEPLPAALSENLADLI
jgi:hypothetical protein